MNKVLLSFLAGLTLGILFAPDKGSNTRKNLRAALDTVEDSLKTGVEELYIEGAGIPEVPAQVV